MKSVNEYRDIAEDCLRHAHAAEDDRDRPLWVTMAQSWLLLAEHRERLGSDLADAQDGDDDSDVEDGRAPSLN
jgi:hypothetical protein